MKVSLDKIKAIRDYWKAGNNMGKMYDRFPEMNQTVIHVLTYENDGKDWGLTLEQYQQALQKIPAGSPYTVIGPVIRSFVGK